MCSTIYQVPRIAHKIEKIYEKIKIYSTFFLGVTLAFDKVWHAELVFPAHPSKTIRLVINIIYNKKMLPHQAWSGVLWLKDIKWRSGTRQRPGTLLYLRHTYNLPEANTFETVTFVDDSALLSVVTAIQEVTKISKNPTDTWKWRFKVNELKSNGNSFTK